VGWERKGLGIERGKGKGGKDGKGAMGKGR